MRRFFSLPGRDGFVPVLLIWALLLCHGVLGVAHQISHECDGAHLAPVASSVHGHGAEHTGDQGTQDSVCEHAISPYFAVLLVAFGVAFLGLVLGMRGPHRVMAPSPFGRCLLPALAHPARGPTLPHLQVFRL